MRSFKDLNVSYKPADGKKRFPQKNELGTTLVVKDFELGIMTDMRRSSQASSNNVRGEERFHQWRKWRIFSNRLVTARWLAFLRQLSEQRHLAKVEPNTYLANETNRRKCGGETAWMREPDKNKWRIRWDVPVKEDGSANYTEAEFTNGKPSVDDIKRTVLDWSQRTDWPSHHFWLHI